MYEGITTYVKQSENAKDKLHVVASAIEALTFGNNIIDPDFEIGAAYQDVIESDEFKYIDRHSEFFYVEDFELPNNTPERYHQATIEAVTIKDIPMYKIYVPMTSKRVEYINGLSLAYRRLMLELFGNELFTMKSKAGFEYEDFSEIREITSFGKLSLITIESYFSMMSCPNTWTC